MAKLMKYITKTIFLLLTLILVSGVLAQEMEVPIEVQYPLFLKILSFDRNLETRSDNEIVIGIVYQDKYKKSVTTKDKLIDVLGKSGIKKINEMPIRFVPINLDRQDLQTIANTKGVNLLYVAPLRAFELKKIAKISRTNQWLTLSGVTDYIEEGLSVGLKLKGNKPQVLINLKSSKAEGANFNSQLLKLAKIVE